VKSEFLRVREVTERLSVKEGIILGWIRDGTLRAVNVAASTAGRPRWRIAPEALADLMAARASATPAPRQRRRRTTDSAEVIKFF
jgi:hypothetical protein